MTVGGRIPAYISPTAEYADSENIMLGAEQLLALHNDIAHHPAQLATTVRSEVSRMTRTQPGPRPDEVLQAPQRERLVWGTQRAGYSLSSRACEGDRSCLEAHKKVQSKASSHLVQLADYQRSITAVCLMQIELRLSVGGGGM